VFNRYRRIRAQEREYLDWPDPLSRAQPAATTGPLHSRSQIA